MLISTKKELKVSLEELKDILIEHHNVILKDNDSASIEVNTSLQTSGFGINESSRMIVTGVTITWNGEDEIEEEKYDYE